MQLVVFDGGRLGALDGDEVVDLRISSLPDPRGPLYAVIASNSPLVSVPTAPRRRLAGVSIEAPLPQPGKILGAPVNYIDQRTDQEAELAVVIGRTARTYPRIGRSSTSSAIPAHSISPSGQARTVPPANPSTHSPHWARQ